MGDVRPRFSFSGKRDYLVQNVQNDPLYVGHFALYLPSYTTLKSQNDPLYVGHFVCHLPSYTTLGIANVERNESTFG